MLTKLSSRVRWAKRAMATQLPKTSWTQRRSDGSGEMSIFASYTTLDSARFRMEATGGSLIALVLGNLLLMIFTLGIATPFAQQRLVRYLVTRLSADGIVDVNAILQSREAVGRTGEGLADAFDVSWI